MYLISAFSSSFDIVPLMAFLLHTVFQQALNHAKLNPNVTYLYNLYLPYIAASYCNNQYAKF